MDRGASKPPIAQRAGGIWIQNGSWLAPNASLAMTFGHGCLQIMASEAFGETHVSWGSPNSSLAMIFILESPFLLHWLLLLDMGVAKCFTGYTFETPKNEVVPHGGGGELIASEL